MELKSTRKILVTIFVVLMAVSTVALCFSATLSATFASQKFITKHIVTDRLVQTCDKQLDIKFEALEQRSGIPSRVFKTIGNTHSPRSAVTQSAEYLFDENDSSLYSEARADYFYELCVEYLEGNEFKYEEENVRLIADEAARIYSDVVGIHNADEIKYYVENVRSVASKIESFAALMLVVCGLIIIMFYKKREEGALRLGTGVMTGGVATIVGAVICIIARVGASIDVAPDVYMSCFASMTKAYFMYLIVAGIIVLAVGIMIFALSAYKINLEKSRKDSRFSKIVVKL